MTIFNDSILHLEDAWVYTSKSFNKFCTIFWAIIIYQWWFRITETEEIGSEFIGLVATNNKGIYQVKFDPDYDFIGLGHGNKITIVSGGNDTFFGFFSTSGFNQSLFVDD